MAAMPSTFAAERQDTRARGRPSGGRTIAFIPIDPGAARAAFVAGSADGKRQLTVRDDQYVYVYTEAP